MKLKPILRGVGVVLLVDGLGAMIAPTKYTRRLETGTPLLDDMLEFCAENPRITRGLAALEITLGAWLALG